MLVDSFKDRFEAAVESADLNLAQGHLLMSLDEPTQMSELARNMGFDASHITSIVDKLEDRNLVERRPDTHDRRVKRIVLTTAGQKARDQIEDQLLATMVPLGGLDAAAAGPAARPARGRDLRRRRHLARQSRLKARADATRQARPSDRPAALTRPG